MRAIDDLGRHHGCGRVGAHAARVGAGVAIADALVVLGAVSARAVLAIAEREKARLLAFEELLDDELRAGGAERAGEAGVDGGLGFLARRWR